MSPESCWAEVVWGPDVWRPTRQPCSRKATGELEAHGWHVALCTQHRKTALRKGLWVLLSHGAEWIKAGAWREPALKVDPAK